MANNFKSSSDDPIQASPEMARAGGPGEERDRPRDETRDRAGESVNDAPSDDDYVDGLFERWRMAFTARGEDIPLDVLCPDRPELHRELKGLIQFEKMNLGGPVPQIITAETRYEILGRYEADHAGGQGELYLARDPRFPRVVLIKRIRAVRATQHDAIVKFRREMLLNGQLEHPNIVPVFDCGEDQGELFLAMRLVPGETYHRLVARLHDAPPAGGLTDSREFRVLLQHLITIAKTVSYAHSRRALHLDISTANIRVGEHGEVYLLDWGAGRRDRDGGGEPSLGRECVASASEDPRRHGLAPVRTDVNSGPVELASSVNPAFMTPEQALGHELTRATDIYQLGAVLHVLLTGRYPYSPERPGTPAFQELVTRVIRGERNPWPRETRIPGPLRAICDKAMDVDRRRRYRTADQFAEELELWLADLPVVSHSYTWAEKLSLSRRKYSGYWLATGAALATTAVALALGGMVLVSRNQALAESRDRAAAALEQLNASQQRVDDLIEGAFGLARQLGDSDLDSMGRLAALDQQLRHLDALPTAADPTALRCLAAIQQGRCKVLERLNRYQEAVTAGEEARQALKRLVESEAGMSTPRESEYADRRILVTVLHDLCRVRLSQYKLRTGRDYIVESLGELGKFPPSLIDQEAELRLLRCISRRWLGSYYETIGNARKALDARRLALEDSAAALAMASNDQCRLEHAQSLRLVARSEQAVASIEEINRTAYRRHAMRHAEQAVELLDECARQVQDSLKWQQARYYADSCLAQLMDEQNQVAAAIGYRTRAIKRLETLRHRDPARAEWLVQLIGISVQGWFRSDPSDAKLRQDGLRSLDQFAREAVELRARYPENVDLRSGGFQWAAAYGRLLLARGLSGVDRDRLIEESTSLCEESERSLRPVLTEAPDAFEFVRRMDVILDYLATTALEKGDQTLHARLTKENARLQVDFFQKRQVDDPGEITWKTCLLDARVSEAITLYQAKRWPDAAQLFRELEKVAGELVAFQPDDPHLLAQQSKILAGGIEAEFAAEYAARKSVSPDFLARQAEAYERILESQRRCCELLALENRNEALAMYTQTLDKILPSVRHDELQLQGAFFERFGAYRPFVRYMRTERERLRAEPSLPVALIQDVPVPSTLIDQRPASDIQESLDLSLKRLELTSWASQLSHFDYDDEQVRYCLERIELLREMGAGKLGEQQAIEARWNVRLLAAALACIHRGGDKGKYYLALSARVRPELETIPVPEMPWSAIAPADSWREMNYATILELALGAGRVADWLELMNNEFRQAAELPKSKGQESTYAENLVARRMLDDLILQPKLRDGVMRHIREVGEALPSLAPALRDNLAAVALLSGEDEIAQKLSPNLNHQSLEGVIIRLAWNGVEARNGRALIERLEVWITDERIFEGARERLKVFLAEHYYLAGRIPDALRIVDEVLVKYPSWTVARGMRWKFLLEQHRSSMDLAKTLGDIPRELVDVDLTAAIVARYVDAIARRRPDDWEKLRELTENPRVVDPAWAWELVGDAARHLGRVDDSMSAYQQSLASFPPTTDPADLAMRRVRDRVSQEHGQERGRGIAP